MDIAQIPRNFIEVRLCWFSDLRIVGNPVFLQLDNICHSMHHNNKCESVIDICNDMK